jgi:hypothetical protein
MIHKYRTQFRVNDGPQPASIESIQRLAHEWLSSKEFVPEGVLETEGDHQLKSGALLAVRYDIVGSEEQWAVRYRRSDDHEPLSWTLDLAATHDGVTTTSSVAMGIELDEQRVVAVARRLRPPAIVGKLSEAFFLTAGCAVTGQPREITPVDVGTFSQWARSPDRVLPIVAVTTDPYSGRPLVSPADIQRLLLGLGEVVLLPKRSAQELTRNLDALLGGRSEAKLWTVHSGAVRVYWPGLDVMSGEASPFAHKLWLPDEQGRLPRNVDEDLFAMLAWAAVHRRYPTWTDFRSIERGRDIEQLQRLVASDSSNRTQLTNAIERLQQDIKDLRGQVAASESTLKASQANCEEAWQQVRDLRADNARLRGTVSGNADRAEADIGDVHAAVEKAKNEFGATIRFAEDLFVDTGESGAFWFGVFGALHDLCREYSTGKIEGHAQVDTLLPDLLETRGCNRKRPKHADTDVERLDPQTGKRVHLRWRLHMRSGAPGETESIYWEPVRQDDETALLIGWIGRHPD